MRATFTSEQQTLREIATGLAADGRCAARAMLDGGQRAPEPTRALIEGFGGLGVPERAGGAGGGLVDVAVLVEGLARQVTPTPVVAHLAALQVATAAGLALPDDVDRDLLTLAVAEPGSSGLGPWRTTIAAERVRGHKVGVPTDPATRHAVITAEHDRLALVSDLAVQTRSSFDPTRPIADLKLDAPTVASADGASAALAAAVVVAAADLCGTGAGAVALAADYAGTREQFGQPIGRFQGVAHQLADALVGVEAAWSLTLYAAWAVEEGAPDALRAAHAAKARAGAAAVFASERGLQVHGGIGVTWEADPHLYVRRALAGSAWLGSTRWHATQLGRALVDA